MAFEVEDVHDAFPYWLVFKCLANGHGLSERGRSAVLRLNCLAQLYSVRLFHIAHTKYLDGSGSVPVAAAAIGLQKYDIDTFRRRLIVLAVEQSSGQRAPAELGALPCAASPACVQRWRVHTCA